MDTLSRARALNDRLLAARRQHRQCEHTLAVLLTEMLDAGLHHALGYANISEYASVVLDISTRQARDLLRIGRRLPALPVLDAAFGAGELDWTKAREVATIATPETESAWVERAKKLTSRKLEAEVARARPGEMPPNDDGPKDLERVRVVIQMDAADAEILRTALAIATARADLKPGEAEEGVLLAGIARRYLADVQAEDAKEEGNETASAEPYRVVIEHCPDCRQVTAPTAEVSETVADESLCDAEVVDMRPGPAQGHASRTIPPATRRAALHRFGWGCGIPGCKNRHWLHVHHLRAWSLGGRHDLRNLLPVCDCHHRMIHDGRLAVSVDDKGVVTVVHGDGRRVVGPPPRTNGGLAVRPTWGTENDAPQAERAERQPRG